MDGNTWGFHVLHYLLEFAQTHVHWVGDALQPSHPLSPPSLQFPPFPASGSFPMSQLFAWGGQTIEVSTSASVLPINTQDWSPLGWTGWISLQSKGPTRVFSSTTVQKHQFFGASRDQTLVPCIGRWILNHWTTREVPFSFFNTPHHIFPGLGISSHAVTVWLYSIYLYHLALGIITMNKASGDDGIPAELFLTLKDSVVKVLLSICQKIWKTQQWSKDWKRSDFILIPQNDNAKEC